MNCESCIHYDGRYCTKDLNNMDYDLLIPAVMEKSPDASCEEWESDKENPTI